MKPFRHIPTAPMRNFLRLLDSCAHEALCKERKNDERRQRVRDEICIRPERLNFGKAFSDAWRRTYQKWFDVPAVHVAPAKLKAFCREVLSGRISDDRIGELKAAHIDYLTELERIASFDQGRIHWAVKTARKALANTLAAHYFDDLQRDSEAVRYVVDLLVSGARQSGNNAQAVSHLTAVMTLVSSSKCFTETERSRALFELARPGSVLGYQVGNTQVLAWCDELAARAQELQYDVAHGGLRHLIRHFQLGLENPDCQEFLRNAREAEHALLDGASRYKLQSSQDLWLSHNAIVPLVRARASCDIEVYCGGSVISIDEALKHIVTSLDERGELHAAALTACTRARALSHWGRPDDARSLLIAYDLKLKMI